MAASHPSGRSQGFPWSTFHRNFFKFWERKTGLVKTNYYSLSSEKLIEIFLVVNSTLSEETLESISVRVILYLTFYTEQVQNVTNVNLRSLALIFISSYDDTNKGAY